ncbi:hypothetical protein AAVH_38353 [Aphelenchoides avenae]|nr:hypothetical protein AAVH_38353 [Aphelenchus avenae]
MMLKVRQKLDGIRQKRAGTAKNDEVAPWETMQPKPIGWFAQRFSPLVSKIRQNLPSVDFTWVPRMGRGMIQKLLYIWKRKTGIKADQVQPIEVRSLEELAPPPPPELAAPLVGTVTTHVPQ